MDIHRYKEVLQQTSREDVLTVPFCSFGFLQIAEFQEMNRPMVLVMKLPRCFKFHSILHACRVFNAHKIVIQGSVVWDLQVKFLKINYVHIETK